MKIGNLSIVATDNNTTHKIEFYRAEHVRIQGFLDMVMLPDFEKSVELKEQLPKKWSDFLMETIADQL